MTVAAQQELVERIWARDATLWSGGDEDKWLGWLDEPKRMQERLADLKQFADEARTGPAYGGAAAPRGAGSR